MVVDSYTKIIVTPANQKMTKWKLVEPFVFELNLPDLQKRIVIDKGFETDFASIPRVFYSVLPPVGRYGVAALVHDYLCVTTYVSRKDADKVFYSIMKESGVKRWKRKVMYCCVRAYAIVTRKK